jgi:uncharacterized spore protein YtfJ
MRGPLVTALVEGDPIQLDGHELVPVVRVTSRVKRRAVLRDEGVGGWGYGAVHMRPVAVLERGENSQLRHSIHNESARTIRWLILVAVLIPWLAALLVTLSRRPCSSGLRPPSA